MGLRKKLSYFCILMTLAFTITALSAGLAFGAVNWNTKAPMSMGKAFLAGAAVDGKIYAVGGYGPGKYVQSNTVEEYDPETNTWTNEGIMPTPRWALFAEQVNSRIYAIGGISNNPGSGSPMSVNEEGILDTQPPTTTANLSGVNGKNGWYISDVDVTLMADDGDGMGVASTEYSFDLASWLTYSFPITISAEGMTTLYYRSTDLAGNVEETQDLTVKIDKTQPVITVISPAGNAEYTLLENIIADWFATDAVSGLFSSSGAVPSGQPIDTGSVGEKTFMVDAEDIAGNPAYTAITYNVRYDYSGVLQPINNDGSSIFKIGKGRTIPVKFQLKDALGNYVSSAIAKIYLAKLSDSVIGTEEKAVSTSAATEGNLFRYDSSSDQYIFNLSTENLSVGTWQIRIELDDGSSKFVDISLN